MFRPDHGRKGSNVRQRVRAKIWLPGMNSNHVSRDRSLAGIGQDSNHDTPNAISILRESLTCGAPLRIRTTLHLLRSSRAGSCTFLHTGACRFPKYRFLHVSAYGITEAPRSCPSSRLWIRSAMGACSPSHVSPQQLTIGLSGGCNV